MRAAVEPGGTRRGGGPPGAKEPRVKTPQFPWKLLAAALLLPLLLACRPRANWIMFRGEQGRGATANALFPPLGTKWKLKLQTIEKQSPAFNPSIVIGDTIYFGSPDGNFYALDIESGYMRWVFKTEGVINSIPFADDQKVYFGSNDGKVYAVDLKTGKQVWSYQTESTVQSTVVRYKDTVVFTSDGGSSYFLTPDGVLKHRIPNPVWHYDTFQVYDNVVYFAPGPLNQPHSLGAFDLQTQSYLWLLNTFALNATWYSFPALKGDRLFFSTSEPLGDTWELSFYAFDRRTGRLIWKQQDLSYWPEGSAADPDELFLQNLKLLDYMAPSVWRNLVIYSSGDGAVRAYRARSGELAWERRFDAPTSSAPTVAGDRVYLGLRGRDGSGARPPRLVCISARSGAKLWEMALEGTLLSAPVISGKWLIFGTDRNLFYVLEELF